MNFLAGWKTFIGGVFLIMIGAALTQGIEVPGFEGQSGGTLIANGLMFIFVRLGIAGK